MNFTRDQKIDILLIVISTISVIASFVLSLDYIAWVAVLLCGVPIFKECAEGLITEFDIKADLLVTIAIIASIIIGEVFAAGEIATIMAIGGFLEEYTVSKAQGQIEELVRMTPQLATRIRNGIEEKIAVEKVEIGDILKVLPGESRECLLQHHRRGGKSPVEERRRPLRKGNESFRSRRVFLQGRRSGRAVQRLIRESGPGGPGRQLPAGSPPKSRPSKGSKRQNRNRRKCSNRK